MAMDPVEANPLNYRVVFENERVRVLEYTDTPGHQTVEHAHPDSVMTTASPIRRRLSSGGRILDVELPAGAARWLPAQEHSGENTGDTDSHAFFVELKEAAPRIPDGRPGRDDSLGPDDAPTS